MGRDIGTVVSVKDKTLKPKEGSDVSKLLTFDQSCLSALGISDGTNVEYLPPVGTCDNAVSLIPKGDSQDRGPVRTVDKGGNSGTIDVNGTSYTWCQPCAEANGIKGGVAVYCTLVSCDCTGGKATTTAVSLIPV